MLLTESRIGSTALPFSIQEQVSPPLFSVCGVLLDHDVGVLVP